MIPLEAVPTELRQRVGPDAPAPMRMMVARALLPMGPNELFSALAYLASEGGEELSRAARTSLADMPRNVVQSVIKDTRQPALLDFALREYHKDDPLAQVAVLNASTSDDAIEWAAKRVSGKLVEIISNNQARVVRHPAIVEAIYYNPEAPMRVVSRVFETGVRSGLDLHHIPGFKEIYTSIFGEDAGKELEAAEREGTGEVSTETQTILVEALPDEVELEVGELEDDDFMAALREASQEEGDSIEVEEEEKNAPLHSLVKKMTVSQKVRLALVGNKTARSLLIKDPKAIVALAVLKSPQISPKEIVNFCKNKALSDRVMAVIARNPKWGKDRKVRESLIKHPKSPAAMVNRWIRQLSVRDLKSLAKSREVPNHVVKLAQNLVGQRQSKRK